MKANRRQFIQTLGAGAAGLSLAAPLGLTSCATTNAKPKEDGQILFIGDNIAVADTTNGKVRGYILRDIHHFLGIPYGADTSGANRFMAPKKPEPWTNIYPAIWYGNSAPQDLSGRWRSKENTFRCHWYFDDVSENCLNIDVYTPGINDNKKRPVIVWLHGGGFYCGNSHEQEAYLGYNLAKLGDVVFCAPNHRLGPFGYSDLSGIGGEKYSASGDNGMLDIVAALQWVHDNISNFGGDPGNVTIIGQSGGGSKVTTATAMPAAKGLIHKAVVLSGARLQQVDKGFSQKVGSAILKESGFSAAQIDKLQEMPWKEYLAMANKASEKLIAEITAAGGTAGRDFGPVVDGVHLPFHPYYPEATPLASDIPMIICSMTNETAPSWRDASLEAITIEGVKDKLKQTYKEKTGEIVDAYAKAFPDKKPVEIWSYIISNRLGAVALANVKSKQQAPVYNAWFGWQPPLFDNRVRAFHMLDICFWFYNTDDMLTYSGGGERPRALAGKMAGSLIQFMKTGDPNGGGLPQWPKYTAEKGELMFLDDVCQVQNDPDREARKSLPTYNG